MDEVRIYSDLKIWQMATNLVPLIYRLTRQLPREEQFALGDQLRRAAVSVPANIAEGHAREHTRAFLNHLSIANGSLAELDTCLHLATRLDYLRGDQIADARTRIGDLRRAIHGLRLSLRRRLETQSLVPRP